MEIKIIKEKVYEYAMALTARAGSTTDAYAQIAMTKDNYPMLDVYMSEAVVQAESTLRKKLSGSNAINLKFESDLVVIKLKDQPTNNADLYNSIESCIKLFLAYHIAASWLLASPLSSLAETFGVTASTHLQAALSALNQKRTHAVANEDYGVRAEDNVVARPGMRLSNNKMLLVKTGEDCCSMEPAIGMGNEHLISK